MRIIEPCCASKQFMFLRDAIGKNGSTQFKAYGDLSLTELLPALLTRYSETQMIIVAPAIPDQAFDIIDEWLHKTWARMDGKGRLNVLAKLTIVADITGGKSPKLAAWLKDNPLPDRLTLIDKPQDNTLLLMPDIAIIGPVNMRYGNPFTCDVTTVPDEVAALWDDCGKLARPAKRSRRSARKTATTEETPEAPATETPAADTETPDGKTETKPDNTETELTEG